MAFDLAQTVPSLDQVLCNVWPEMPANQFQKYDYYLVKAENEERKRAQVWTNIITDKVKWTPNMATVMRSVLVEDAPVLRQEARPNYITVEPDTDIFNVRERIVESRLQWKEFQSVHFSWLPAFQDFMKGNLVPTRKTIERQIQIYEDLYYRTYVWDNSPNVYVANQGKFAAPVGVDANMDSYKTAGYLANLFNQTGGIGHLSAEELFKAAAVFTQEIGATPFSGNGAARDNQILDEKFMLLCSNEAWMQMINDPWIKENRPLAMNIVNNAFKGPLFDTIMARIEKYPLRFTLDANNSPTYPAPETSELNPNASDCGRTKPLDSYTTLDGAQVEVAWLIGGKGYRRIDSGPPPELFAGSTADPSKLPGMQWNGQVYLNKFFMIPCKDRDGNTQYKLNDKGRYVRWDATMTLGCVGLHTWNIMPILFRRRRGTTTSGVV